MPTPEADIVIVGAGSAGCVLARRLADRTKATVVLLEAGEPLDPTVAVDGWRLPTLPDWGLESEPSPTGPGTRLRRGRLVGGTSWFTRFAVRGATSDFDAWAERGNDGWSFEDVLPAFRRLEADAEYGHEPWHGEEGPIPLSRYPGLPRSPVHVAVAEALGAAGFPAVADHNAPGAAGIGPMPMSVRDGRRVTTADAYLPSADRPANLELRTGRSVAAIDLEAGRAVGVRLVDGSRVRSGAVILSAGVYGSPTILMRSGIGPAGHLREHRIPVVADLPGVGGNLADHPGVDLDLGWRGDGGDGPLLHSIATFRSSLTGSDESPDLMFWLSDPDAADPGFYLDPILLKPASRGTVRLRSTEPEDRPRISLPGIQEPEDRARLVEGYRLAVELVNRPEVRALCVEPAPDIPDDATALDARIQADGYSIPHVVGTCRMGPSPGEGDVVDQLGRVHGIDGLFVVDASIIPDPPSGFPHVVTIMAAEHLATRIPI
jgi:choline dehydrogenase